MKPRRWYSSREHNPEPGVQKQHPFPTAIYWAFTTRTRRDQGAIIKAEPAETGSDGQRRGASPRAPRPPRLIDAA
jgi:hypothetical protein